MLRKTIWKSVVICGGGGGGGGISPVQLTVPTSYLLYFNAPIALLTRYQLPYPNVKWILKDAFRSHLLFPSVSFISAIWRIERKSYDMPH